MKQQKEYALQVAISQYLKIRYPQVLFLSDTVAFLKLNMQQAVRNKKIQKSGFKCPDMIILEPRKNYSGLFLELKIQSPFKKNGELKSNEQLQGQADTLKKLNDKGYLAQFVWSFDQAREVIDEYLGRKGDAKQLLTSWMAEEVTDEGEIELKKIQEALDEN